MALENIDAKVAKMLDPVVQSLRNVDPNAITWTGSLIGLAGAILLVMAGTGTQGATLLLVGTATIFLSWLFDVLDGAVARAHSRTSRWGDYLDHTFDRLVDTAYLLALTYNATWSPDSHWGWWVVLATLLGSYMGTQAKSCGLPRDLSGFGRNDRLAVLMLGTLVTAAQAWRHADGEVPQLNGFAVALVICGIGGVWTFLVRFRNARRHLCPPSKFAGSSDPSQ